VNTILPGGIDTPMTEGFDWTQLEIPMRRVIQPEELAKTIVHLAGSESSFTTGAELVVDGGQMLNIPRYDAMHGLRFTGPLQQR
jgi:3alpha(or 20beta)-hydroxysteroid dehydrogenase